jgi:hypothetical protein
MEQDIKGIGTNTVRKKRIATKVIQIFNFDMHAHCTYVRNNLLQNK